MEGNIRIPQNGLGIVALGASKVLESADINIALQQLVTPISIGDEGLLARTRKANAQHVHYGIEKVLDPVDVRRIEIKGNYEILRLLGEALGVAPPKTNDLVIEPLSGVWAEPGIVAEVEIVSDNLSPEKVIFLKQLLSEVVKLLNSEKIKNLLESRRARFDKWSTKESEQQGAIKMDNGSDLKYVSKIIIEALDGIYKDAPLEEWQHAIVKRLQAVITDASL